MSTEDRRLDVLRAIVEDYVATHEPVGSKALVERHGFDVSPATVRNDMAALEEDGLIIQPHTSAGRIPTDKGYRFFVDRLTELKPMSAAERRAIAAFLEDAYDIDDVMQRSVRLLAQLTQQVAIIQYPSLSRSTIRHIELVMVATGQLLVVLILSDGRVEQRVVEVDSGLTDEELSILRLRINEATRGSSVADAAEQLTHLLERTEEQPHADSGHTLTTPVVAALIEALATQPSDERVVVGGTANLVRFADSFDTSIRPILEALEEHVILLQLLGRATSSQVTVSIGHEGPYDQLATTSVVTSGYGGQPEYEPPLGALGVVGPTRMDYPGTMSAVGAVAGYISAILDENNNRR